MAEQRVRPALRDLADTIPGISGLVEGHSTSPEGLEDGHDYGFVLTFDSAEARDAYLPDPRHQVVAEEIGRYAQRVVVFDI